MKESKRNKNLLVNKFIKFRKKSEKKVVQTDKTDLYMLKNIQNKN